MKHFKLTLIILFSVSIQAEPVQIDMHGGKHMKIPSQFKQNASMKNIIKKDMLNMDTNTTDKNTTTEKK